MRRWAWHLGRSEAVHSGQLEGERRGALAVLAAGWMLAAESALVAVEVAAVQMMMEGQAAALAAEEVAAVQMMVEGQAAALAAEGVAVEAAVEAAGAVAVLEAVLQDVPQMFDGVHVRWSAPSSVHHLQSGHGMMATAAGTGATVVVKAWEARAAAESSGGMEVAVRSLRRAVLSRVIWHSLPPRRRPLRLLVPFLSTGVEQAAR